MRNLQHYSLHLLNYEVKVARSGTILKSEGEAFSQCFRSTQTAIVYAQHMHILK